MQFVVTYEVDIKKLTNITNFPKYYFMEIIYIRICQRVHVLQEIE